jgi:hypothetical protein
MKGLKDREAALEAKQESALSGVGKVPVGSYLYWNRRREHFDLCRVEVFLLEVDRQLSRWKEKGQCQARWFEPDEAARAVQETNLVALIEQLGGSEIVGE